MIPETITAAKKPPDPDGSNLMTAQDVETLMEIEDESQEAKQVPEGHQPR